MMFINDQMTRITKTICHSFEESFHWHLFISLIILTSFH